MLLCKFCNKECKNENSLRNHSRLCKSNPERQYTAFSDPNTNPSKLGSGSNQYIKAAKLGLPKPIISLESRQVRSLATTNKNLKESQESKNKRIATINAKVEDGTWHTSLARKMHINYNGVDLHGSWELKYAQYLDKNEIKWVRNSERFSYLYENKSRKYCPDFYLIDTDEYIEIKGYKTEKDDAKWFQFPKDKRLNILFRNDLISLGVL